MFPAINTEITTYHGKCSSGLCETVVQKIVRFAFVRNNQDTVQFAAVRINFACLKELRQIAGKELRQKSFSGVSYPDS